MKIRRKKKIKDLINSENKLRFGDKVKKMCFACGEILQNGENGFCPNCKTYNNNILKK